MIAQLVAIRVAAHPPGLDPSVDPKFTDMIHGYFPAWKVAFSLDKSQLGAVHILRQPLEGGEGVSQKMTIADEGGRGGKPNADNADNADNEGG